MPRYFFTVDKSTTDTEGEELADDDAARLEAIESARELLSEGALGGSDWGSWSMVVENEAGETVLTLPFSEVLQKNRPRPRKRRSPV